MSIQCVNPSCYQGDPGDPPEFVSDSPMRCPNCHEMIDADEGCPDCRRCATKSCDGYAHPDSESCVCASCELTQWTSELKRLWMVNPPDAELTAEAEAQMRIWQETVRLESVDDDH